MTKDIKFSLYSQDLHAITTYYSLYIPLNLQIYGSRDSQLSLSFLFEILPSKIFVCAHTHTYFLYVKGS